MVPAINDKQDADLNSKRHRKCKKKPNNGHVTESSSDEDVFKVSDDEDKDKNYDPPPPKKFRSRLERLQKLRRLTEEKKKKQKSPVGCQSNTQTVSNVLTPIVQPNSQITSNETTPAVQPSSQIIPSAPIVNFDNLDDYFGNGGFGDECAQLIAESPPPNCPNENEKTVSRTLFSTDEPTSIETLSRIMDVVQEMSGRITDLTNNVNLLRKQVSRIELKSMHASNVVRGSSDNLHFDSDALLDLDSALDREGLPLKTCVEINDFEKKLRDTQFRSKMVRKFLHFHYEIIHFCCFDL